MTGSENMKLGSLFGKPKTLAISKKPVPTKQSKLAVEMEKKKKPGQFDIVWPTVQPQQVKDYQAILTVSDLKKYLKRCVQTGKAGFDWETAASEEIRKHYAKAFEDIEIACSTGALDEKEAEKQREVLEKEYLRTPLDPWKGEICTVSLSAAAHESHVVPISHKVGQVFEPEMTRDEARKVVLDLMDEYLFQNKDVIKIAVNLSFETKYAVKYGKYILGKVADPLIMWVRCMQIVAPNKIKNPKKPTSGWGLKPATKHIFGVTMNDFTVLLKKYKVDFFDEIDASKGDGLLYSAEDADYAVQHYEYWSQIASQIPRYEEWLHKVEMPFTRVIGLMEYWGMAWDENLATQNKQEAEIMQEQAAERIKQIAKETFSIDINTGKSGKTNEVKSLMFDYLKIPVAKYGKTGASLDQEALIDMAFMLENKLDDIDEEKYLGVSLPEDWENINPDTDPMLDKLERGAIRIAKREPHPYREEALEVIEQLKKIQKYTTLLSSHIVGREKYLNFMSGRIHAGYSPFTETGRLNSFNPKPLGPT